MDTSSTRANAKEERSKTMDGEKSIAIDNDETTTRRRLHTVGIHCGTMAEGAGFPTALPL